MCFFVIQNRQDRTMMKFFLAMMCLASTMLMAESIGDVAFKLPPGWKVANELNTCKGTNSRTVIYIPENTTKENALEFFAVHTNDLPSTSLDKAAIEKILQIQFPKREVFVNIMENTPDTVLYEWGVKNGNHEELHGIARIFSTKNGVRILSYQTERAALFDQVRSQWIQVLKDSSH